MHTSYRIVAETISEYYKLIREYEQLREYEKNIVCSVPQRDISIPSFKQTTKRLEEPG